MKTIFIISLIIYLVYINIISTKSLHMLQQNRYNRGYRYIKWIIKNRKENFLNLTLIFFLYLLFLLSNNLISYLPYVFIILTIFLGYVFISNRLKENIKIPLKYTSRIKRLILTNNIIHLIPCIIMLLTFDESALPVYYFILGLIAYLNLFTLILINFLNRPLEKLVALHFKREAERKLKSMTNMKVIGITGSYGKTSSKNILCDILNVKYNAFKTPANYNTPFGLMITINNYLDKYNDYFIAEMGACKKGEIKELCDLVHPTYGILTKIGLAHLETFGSEENIQKTKFELIESLPEDGIGVLNGDDEKQKDYILKNKCKIIWIGIDNHRVDCYAKDIELTYKGTKFNVKFKNLDKEYKFETKLLGRANIYNILAGIALGHELGISIKDLQSAVKKVSPVEHRLCMKKYYDINLIDDAYNANPNGCEMAVEVLSQMPGKKIIVTSGMIELGSKSYEKNKELGLQIASHKIDDVILIGKEQTKPIQDGLKECQFSEEHIHILNDIMDSFPLMQQLKDGDTYVLLQSDLPDTFNEK